MPEHILLLLNPTCRQILMGSGSARVGGFIQHLVPIARCTDPGMRTQGTEAAKNRKGSFFVFLSEKFQPPFQSFVFFVFSHNILSTHVEQPAPPP